MTTQHPHPEDQRSADVQSTLADVPMHNSNGSQEDLDQFSNAAQDMRTMHTRLADLLDQVSVTPAPDDNESFSEELSENGHSLGTVMPDQATSLLQNGSERPLESRGALGEPVSLENGERLNRYDNGDALAHSTSVFEQNFGNQELGERRENGMSDETSMGDNFYTSKEQIFGSAAQSPEPAVGGLKDTFGHILDPTDGHNSSPSEELSNSSNDIITNDDDLRSASVASSSFPSDSFSSGTVSRNSTDSDSIFGGSATGQSVTIPSAHNIDNSDEMNVGEVPTQDIDLADSGVSQTDANQTGTNGAITIKGRSDGIAVEIGAGSWRMLMVQLRQRLHQSSGFFRGGTVSMDVGSRALTGDELAAAKEVLNEHGLNLSLVRSTSEETSLASATLGVTATLEPSDESTLASASTNHEELSHFVYRGNLRSGQILRRSETILLLGDVNPGAHVESAGDILVWGRLRGIAHAGSTGDTKAIISAMLMEPTQLRINESIAVMPSSDERRSLFGVKKRNPDLAPRPEVAYIVDGTIVVEPWDESKPGGIMAFRR